MTMRKMKNDQKKMSLDTVLSYFLYYMTAGCFTFVYPRMKNEEKSLQINHENKLDILLSHILVYRKMSSCSMTSSKRFVIILWMLCIDVNVLQTYDT